jgi:hypothetical protein
MAPLMIGDIEGRREHRGNRLLGRCRRLPGGLSDIPWHCQVNLDHDRHCYRKHKMPTVRRV